MNTSSPHPSKTEPRDCTELLRALQQEMQAAVHAISRNALSDLELSLWRQEMLCGRAKRNLAAMSEAARNEASGRVLREALTRVKAESDKYRKVVLRCSRSAAVLQDLCLLYRGAAPLCREDTLSLSCEV